MPYRTPKRVQLIANQTITATGNSGAAVPNNSQCPIPAVEAVLNVPGAVSGTTPSLTVSIWEVDPVSGSNVLLGTFAAVTATLANPLRLAFQSVFGTGFFASWAVSGTTPSFGGVELDLYYTPDPEF